MLIIQLKTFLEIATKNLIRHFIFIGWKPLFCLSDAVSIDLRDNISILYQI